MVDQNRLDSDIDVLRSHADTWLHMDLASRIKYLEDVFDGTFAVADDQVDAAVKAKGVKPGSAMAAEDYLAGPVVQGRTIRLMLDSLKQIRDQGQVQIKAKHIRDVGPDQIAVQVIPHDVADTLLLTGFEAEIWQAPGINRNNISDNIAEFYRQDHSDQPGRVALVLGAGNVASIGPLDVIHKLFVEGQVCLLKMNPVNDYLGPFIERAFKGLIDSGFMRLAYGGGDVGAYLCQHENIDEIHITGSNFTHDAIVFGTGEDGQRRKAENQPRNHKRITSELGNVSPVIIVPGSWNQAELRFHAENIATQMTNNGGFNCNAAKVLIFHENWNQRTEFMDMLKSVLAKLPSRPAYYPGAEARYDKFVDGHEQAIPIGERTDSSLPWTLIPDCSSDDTNEICFVEESFCGITAQTTLPGDDAADFLKNAVDFCNERLWGTLNACIIVHPATEKRIEADLNTAIKDLRYGSVAINHWPGLCYGMGATAWGAYPGHTLDDIQSGIGFVHNTKLFDRPEKTVLRGPFKVFPKPPWFVTHKRSLAVARRMTSMEKKPSLAKVPGIAWNAIKGS